MDWTYSTYARNMSVVGIVPIRSFSMGKYRLADSLGDRTRRELSQQLASHVTGVASESNLIPLVVTSDPEVAEWSIRNGFPIVEDTNEGLDAAVHAGILWSVAARSGWLSLHSDLPLLTTDDLSKLLQTLDAHRSPIAPSMDGGTSALGGSEDFMPAYGVSSFHRHLSRLPNPEIVVSTGLLHDIDSYDALVSASRHGRGQWLKQFLT